MTLSAAILAEFDHEMANTRKTLERLPDGKFPWKPHEKSGTMGQIAGHLANLAGFAVTILNQDSLDIAPNGIPMQQPAAPSSRHDLLALFDKNVSSARAAIAKASDADLSQPWSLLRAGKSIMTMPRIALLRNSTINHSIHHRAQLGVYLRLNNIPVPALSGPSADETAS